MPLLWYDGSSTGSNLTMGTLHLPGSPALLPLQAPQPLTAEPCPARKAGQLAHLRPVRSSPSTFLREFPGRQPPFLSQGAPSRRTHGCRATAMIHSFLCSTAVASTTGAHRLVARSLQAITSLRVLRPCARLAVLGCQSRRGRCRCRIARRSPSLLEPVRSGCSRCVPIPGFVRMTWVSSLWRSLPIVTGPCW